MSQSRSPTSRRAAPPRGHPHLPLNDHAVVPVMVGLHRHLRAGRNLAESLCNVRGELTGDPVQQATGVSLITLGAG